MATFALRALAGARARGLVVLSFGIAAIADVGEHKLQRKTACVKLFVSIGRKPQAANV